MAAHDTAALCCRCHLGLCVGEDIVAENARLRSNRLYGLSVADRRFVDSVEHYSPTLYVVLRGL